MFRDTTKPLIENRYEKCVDCGYKLSFNSIDQIGNVKSWDYDCHKCGTKIIIERVVKR